ncbi:MAG: hypothetical protein ACR2KV_14280 [Solirubrobacteraceae bacterium]
MPTISSARLLAGTAATLLCLSPLAARPALAASHPKKPKSLTLATARSTALKSATPLILDPADAVRVTGCTRLAGSGYSCGLELHAASSASICNWTVVVRMVRGVPDVVRYSSVDCAG